MSTNAKHKSTVKTQDQENPQALKNNWVYYLPVLLAVVVYWSSLSFDFCGDDPLVAQANSFVQKGIKGIPDIFSHSYLYGYSMDPDPIYRPIPLALYATESHFFGLSSKILHFFNLVWYCLCIVLLFRFLKSLQIDETVLLVTTVLFSIHPIHTEVVSNIKSRDEIAAACGLFFALYYVVKLSHSWSVNKVLAVIIGLLFSFLSKESMIPAIVIIPILVHIYLEKDLVTTGKIAALGGISVVLYYLLRASIDTHFKTLDVMQNSLVEGAGFWGRFPTVMFTTLKYWILSFFPFPLSYDYSYSQIPLLKYSSILFIVSMMFLLFSLFAIYYFYKRNRWISFFILFFYCFLIVSSNLFFLTGSTFAERFLFTPVLSACFIIAQALFYFKERKPDLPWKIIFGVFTLMICVYANAETKKWKNDNALFQSGVNTAPKSARTNMFYAKYLQDKSKKLANEVEKNKIMDQSLNYYRKALDIYPKFQTAWHYYGWACRDRGLIQEERNAYQKAFESDGTYFPALISWSISFMKQDSFNQALPLLLRAQSLRPNTYDIEYNLGLCYRNLKQFDQAIGSFKNANGINAKREEPISQLIKIYRDDLNKIDSALYYNDLIKTIK